MELKIKEEIKLTVRDVLLTFFDGMAKVEEIFGYRFHRKRAREYWKWRDVDKQNLYNILNRLKKQKYIKDYTKSKEGIIKLTPLGEKKALRYISDDFKIKYPKLWDKKWHVVIFDIPEDKKSLRDVARKQLKKWGFYQLQKSVFVFPYGCHELIQALKYIYGLGKFMLYMKVDTIETEDDITNYFFDKQVLKDK